MEGQGRVSMKMQKCVPGRMVQQQDEVMRLEPRIVINQWQCCVRFIQKHDGHILQKQRQSFCQMASQLEGWKCY